jgi:hypothetical protein
MPASVAEFKAMDKAGKGGGLDKGEEGTELCLKTFFLQTNVDRSTSKTQLIKPLVKGRNYLCTLVLFGA